MTRTKKQRRSLVAGVGKYVVTKLHGGRDENGKPTERGMVLSQWGELVVERVDASFDLWRFIGLVTA